MSIARIFAVAILLFARSATFSQADDPSPILIDEAAPRFLGATPRLWSAIFSPDSKSLAVTAGWENPDEPGELVLWNVDARRPTLIRRQDKTIRAVAFSRDGKLVAIGDFAGGTALIDATTGKVTTTFPAHSKLVNSVAFTPIPSRWWQAASMAQ